MATFQIKEHSAEIETAKARILCTALADYYLEKFNQYKRTGKFPRRYLSLADAMRDCQFLCEKFRILAFELTDEAAINW